VALVSFNSDAFESYGRSRNENAPVCRHCVDAYTTALNRLLDRSYPDPKHPGQTLSRRFVALSDDTTAVFWATEKATILDLLADFFDAPRVESVAALLESSHKGRPSGSASNRFYCLILSGGQGRALLRGMHMGTVAQVEDNMRAYFESLDVGFEGPLPLSRIMRGLVLQGKTQNLPPGLTSDLFLAIVCGRKFPETVLTRAVERCRTERKVIRERAAILRAYLIRNLRWEVNVGLDKENTRPGYRLGRLMAVLEKVQTEAQGGISRTIVGYGAASTRPATVFSRLIGLAQHYIPQCRRPVFFQKLLAEVLEGIAVFPPTLSLEEQGLFALGYYHQKQDFYKKHDGETAETESEKGEAV